jgi:hypothetical protein
MANRFWVGGTGTWGNASTAFWSTTDGGGGGASIPGTGDVAIFNANSGGGTVTVDSPNGAGVVTVQQITMGAFTGTLDFATNDNNVTLSTQFSGTGSGARTLNMGDGTWTLTNTGAVTIWDVGTATNFTLNANSSTILINGTATTNQSFSGGAGLSYNNVTVSRSAVSNKLVGFGTSCTIANLTLTNTRYITLTAGITLTISGNFVYDGSSSSVGVLTSTTGATATINVAGTQTVNWLSIGGITRAGAGTLTANNSFDMGGNSSITAINAPVTGGGAGIVMG